MELQLRWQPGEGSVLAADPPRGHTGSARVVWSPTLSSTEVELLLQGTWVTCHTASAAQLFSPAWHPKYTPSSPGMSWAVSWELH